jgi:hypothetical protein
MGETLSQLGIGLIGEILSQVGLMGKLLISRAQGREAFPGRSQWGAALI